MDLMDFEGENLYFEETLAPDTDLHRADDVARLPRRREVDRAGRARRQRIGRVAKGLTVVRRAGDRNPRGERDVESGQGR